MLIFDGYTALPYSRSKNANSCGKEQMSEIGQGILKGLEEALDFANGQKSAAVVHIPEEIDVKRIRRKFKMSQNRFAEYFGFKVSTLRDWEQGRRVPTGPARHFLFVIDKEPEAVRRALVTSGE
ncbi:MAG: helix-turn-helix domain-containing protein [Pseudomonadota bacterium]